MPRLSAERWRQLIPHLDRGLELAEAERGPWLAAVQATDPGLAADLEELLSTHRRLDEEAFLRDPLADAGSRPSLAGQRCGAYTLLSPIGQGGMGSVWLAERTDGRFQGQAAVKLLNASLVGRDADARFRREGTILARLRHPHIAGLIDAGVSPQGQPYLVLERVAGERIDRHCDAAQLGLEARLRLFLDVLAAVSHAHASLVVHRDLKPSNVMVDGSGRVQLLDFGIAKLLEGDGDDAPTALTRDGQSMLTPEFAAPEQLSGGPITTATDVYGLGVLLFVLLTGRHPAGDGTNPAALVRAIVETESPRASDVPTGPFRRALRGDLDNVVAKALRKQPADRYASVDLMADDLRRFLAHEPVAASAGSRRYRARKFLRRHRVAAAVAAVLLLTVLLGAGGVLWQARVAQRERNDARAQLARATAATDFMNVLLNVAAPAGDSFTVNALLEHGAGVIDKQFASDASMRAELLADIGSSLIMRDDLARARPVLDRAVAVARQAGDRAMLARAACPRALLHVAGAERQAGEALMAEALAGVADEPRHAVIRAGCLTRRSSFGYYYEEAGPMIRDATAALEILDRAPVSARLIRLEAMSSLAYGHYLARHTRQAEAAYARLWAQLEAMGIERTSIGATTLNNWSLLHYWGDIGRAEDLARRCVELRRAIEGAEVAPTGTNNHAGALLRLGRYDEAQQAFEETIVTARRRKETRIEFDATMALADVHIARGDLEAAARQLALLDPVKDTPAFSPGRRVQLVFYRGHLALARGEYADGKARLLEAAALFEPRPKITMTVLTYVHLARAQHGLGESKEALASARKAIAMAESFVEPGSPSYLIGHGRLAEGDVLQALGSTADAQASYRRALEHLERTLGPRHEATEAARRAVR